MTKPDKETCRVFVDINNDPASHRMHLNRQEVNVTQ